MSLVRSRVAPTLILLSTLAITSTIARPAAADCAEFISEANARALFDTLAAFKGDDGCALENVRTDRWKMDVEWKKGEAVQAPVLVTPTSCASSPSAEGKVLSIAVPPAVQQACPAAVAKMTALVKSETFGGLVQATPIPSETKKPPRLLMFIGIGLSALVALAVIGAIARRRGAKKPAEAASEAPAANAAEASASEASATEAAPAASEAASSAAPASEAGEAKVAEVPMNGVNHAAKSNEISAAN